LLNKLSNELQVFLAGVFARHANIGPSSIIDSQQRVLQSFCIHAEEGETLCSTPYPNNENAPEKILGDGFIYMKPDTLNSERMPEDAKGGDRTQC